MRRRVYTWWRKTVNRLLEGKVSARADELERDRWKQRDFKDWRKRARDDE